MTAIEQIAKLIRNCNLKNKNAKKLLSIVDVLN